MKWRLNKTQKQNLARFFYDLAKLGFGAIILTKAWEGSNVILMVFGLSLVLFCVILAVDLEKESRDVE